MKGESQRKRGLPFGDQQQREKPWPNYRDGVPGREQERECGCVRELGKGRAEGGKVRVGSKSSPLAKAIEEGGRAQQQSRPLALIHHLRGLSSPTQITSRTS
jgi:hypothetical protein